MVASAPLDLQSGGMTGSGHERRFRDVRDEILCSRGRHLGPAWWYQSVCKATTSHIGETDGRPFGSHHACI